MLVFLAHDPRSHAHGRQLGLDCVRSLMHFFTRRLLSLNFAPLRPALQRVCLSVCLCVLAPYLRTVSRVPLKGKSS